MSSRSDAPRPQLPEDDRRARKQAMIAAIAVGRTVIDAAHDAGIGWRKAYVWRAEDPEFRAAWNQARTQIRNRPTLPYQAPSSPPLAAAEPLSVPPSPPAMAPAPAPPPPPRVMLATGGSPSFHEMRKARPGDKIVHIIWSRKRSEPDRFWTKTLDQNGVWMRDEIADQAAYDQVKPPENERLVFEIFRYVFAGPEGDMLRPGEEDPQPGDCVLDIIFGGTRPPRLIGAYSPMPDGNMREIRDHDDDYCRYQRLLPNALDSDREKYGREKRHWSD